MNIDNLENLYTPGYVGFDPGINNFGVSLVCASATAPWKFHVVVADSLSIEPGETLVQFCQRIWSIICGQQFNNLSVRPVGMTIERYVTYSGVAATEIERINQMLGIFMYYAESNRIPIVTYKAVDWKIRLCKILNKHAGFDNPSSNLDKKFSNAAANFITENTNAITNHHQADATCLAALPTMEQRIRLAQSNTSKC